MKDWSPDFRHAIATSSITITTFVFIIIIAFQPFTAKLPALFDVPLCRKYYLSCSAVPVYDITIILIFLVLLGLVAKKYGVTVLSDRRKYLLSPGEKVIHYILLMAAVILFFFMVLTFATQGFQINSTEIF